MPGKLLYVQVEDMEPEMKEAAEKLILETFDMHSREDIIASTIKKEFDKMYEPQCWNVIVGKNFGSKVVNKTQCYMFATYNNDETAILLWKS